MSWHLGIRLPTRGRLVGSMLREGVLSRSWTGPRAGQHPGPDGSLALEDHRQLERGSVRELLYFSISLFSHLYYTCLPLRVLILWTPSLVYLPCDMCHITYGHIITSDMSLSHSHTGISLWLCINMTKQCLMISMTHCLTVI